MLGFFRRTINGVLRLLGFRLQRLRSDSQAFLPTVGAGMSPEECETNRLLNVLSYAKASDLPYRADGYVSGYHSIVISGQKFKGQREPQARLDITPFDFTGKFVLDIGCNQGGMLQAVADRVHSGVGVDFDSRMINAANRICANRGISHLHFYVFDIEHDPLVLLNSLRLEERVDIVFLLSVCMWIRNWREVIAYARRIAPCMLFESNGSVRQQEKQEAELHRQYGTVQLLKATSPDDATQANRRLFFCRA